MEGLPKNFLTNVLLIITQEAVEQDRTYLTGHHKQSLRNQCFQDVICDPCNAMCFTLFMVNSIHSIQNYKNENLGNKIEGEIEDSTVQGSKVRELPRKKLEEKWKKRRSKE